MKDAEFNDISQFYSICKKIVKGYPPQYGGSTGVEMVALRLNTFAVINSLDDLNLDNLGKRPQFADSPNFYSRVFANSGHTTGSFKLEYPLFAIIENVITVNRKLSDEYELRLFICDQLPEYGDFYNDQYSKNREVQEVARDIRQHFKKLIGILRNWVYATFTDTTKNGWYDETFLISESEVYTSQMSMSDIINMDSLQFEVFGKGIDKCLVGTTTIKVQANNCVIGMPVINYDIEDYEIYNNQKIV